MAWRLLDVSRASVRSLEESTTRVGATQTAGLIALWTQLHTFDDRLAEALVWAAWAILVVSLLVLARLVAPRRLARFWGGVPGRDVLDAGRPMTLEEEVALVRELTTTITGQERRLRTGLTLAIALAALALVAAAAAYVLEKT